jgi:acylphosphatase
MVRARAIVTGVVQGVGFRYFAARLADHYGITGYAKNLPNGDVEIEAEGDKSLVSGYLGEIRNGPRHAHVTGIHVEWLEPRNYKIFTTY